MASIAGVAGASVGFLAIPPLLQRACQLRRAAVKKSFRADKLLIDIKFQNSQIKSVLYLRRLFFGVIDEK
jgi:hypothetical protein